MQKLMYTNTINCYPILVFMLRLLLSYVAYLNFFSKIILKYSVDIDAKYLFSIYFIYTFVCFVDIIQYARYE